MVTGGAGFAGSYLLPLLKTKEKAEIFSLDRGPALEVTSLQMDLLDLAKVRRTILELAPDEVYHLAAFASAASEEKDLIFNINVGATENLLKSLAQTGKKVRIVLISSLYVYGIIPLPAREKNPLDPQGAYGQSKAQMERVGEKFMGSNLEIVIARPANHTGAGQKLGFVVPDFASQIVAIEKKKQKPVLRVGNLTAQRDFLDVRDVVGAYYLLMKKGQPGEAYNISTGKPYSIEEILNRLLKLSWVKIKIALDKKKFRPVDLPLSSGNPSKIKKLGWHAKIPLDRTLKDVLDYWRKRWE